jgi:Zn-dependent protease with chaperone function
MKRVFLFLATNLAILVVLGITANLLEGFLASQGIVFQNSSLLIFAAVFGMGGSFLSLAMSKWIAKRATSRHGRLSRWPGWGQPRSRLRPAWARGCSSQEASGHCPR